MIKNPTLNYYAEDRRRKKKMKIEDEALSTHQEYTFVVLN